MGALDKLSKLKSSAPVNQAERVQRAKALESSVRGSEAPILPKQSVATQATTSLITDGKMTSMIIRVDTIAKLKEIAKAHNIKVSELIDQLLLHKEQSHE
jgi:hypothetical protein